MPNIILAQQQLRAGAHPGPHLIGLKLLQVFQYGPPYAAERGLDDAIATARDYGFTGLLVKALDGANWMRVFDRTPDALGSTRTVAEQRQRAHAAGLRYFCWTNPRHDVDLSLEASLTAAIAAACDGVFLDTEPYRQFWSDDAPPGLADTFLESIRAAAPDAFLALQPDPRPDALRQLRIHEWLPYVDALAGQHYWTDFGTAPADELRRAVELGQQLGQPILPTLPGNALSGSVPTEQIAQLPGFVVWRLGTTSPDTLRLLGASRVAGLATPKLEAT